MKRLWWRNNLSL